MRKFYIFWSAMLFGIAGFTHAVAPYISIRSQSVDAARELVGWAHKVNLFDMEKLYGTFAITLEGTGSFKPSQLSRCLFGISDDCCQTFSTTCTASIPGTCAPCCEGIQIPVQGSRVANRSPNAWLADYFGLSPSWQSTLSFKPRINQFIADFNLYVGLDEWLCGSYFRIHAPVVWTKWNLHACESITTTSTLIGYTAGYFGPLAVPASALVPSALAFFENQAVPTLGGGVTFQPLTNAQFACKGATKTALAEIQMALGWNFFIDECYHFGLNFRVYAPTGNRPTGQFLFEPIVGNGKSWEVGGGLTTHYTFWQSEDEDSSFGLYIDGNFTTLLRTRQTRTFDLVGRPMSRYMLAEKMTAPPMNLFANILPGDQAGSTAPAAQFANVFTPVANLTTLSVKVHSKLQADVVAMFNYTNCNFEFDFGYDFWARTCENIDLNCDCTSASALADGTTWALKGDAAVYGFAQTSSGAVTAGQAIALSATESNATINSGTNFPSGNGPIIPQRNPNVDHARFARFVADNTAGANIVWFPGGGAGDQIETSLQPVFITEIDPALNDARTQGMTHKVFAHLSYTWRDNECWMPYLGVGGKAEFAAKSHCGSCSSGCGGSNACCNGNVNCNPIASGGLPACPPFIDNDCGGCQRCSVSEWGVWIKGGISFN